MRLIILILFVISGCSASSKIYQYSGIDSKSRVEDRELPSRPDAEKIPEDVDWAVPLSAGACTERDGILLSPEKAVRAKSWQNGYNTLRKLYELDREVWRNQRIIYEDRIKRANQDIRDISPTWWDQNKGTLSLASGFFMGAATSIAIAFALDSVLQ